MTDQDKLKAKLRLLIRRKSSAPAYQKELIQREITRTRQLLKSVYGEDPVAKIKKATPYVLLSVGSFFIIFEIIRRRYR